LPISDWINLVNNKVIDENNEIKDSFKEFLDLCLEKMMLAGMFELIGSDRLNQFTAFDEMLKYLLQNANEFICRLSEPLFFNTLITEIINQLIQNKDLKGDIIFNPSNTLRYFDKIKNDNPKIKSLVDKEYKIYTPPLDKKATFGMSKQELINLLLDYFDHNNLLANLDIFEFFSQLNGYFVDQNLEIFKMGNSKTIIIQNLIELGSLTNNKELTEQMNILMWQNEVGAFNNHQNIKEWFNVIFTQVKNYKGTDVNLMYLKNYLNHPNFQGININLNSDEFSSNEALLCEKIFQCALNFLGSFTTISIFSNLLSFQGNDFSFKRIEDINEFNIHSIFEIFDQIGIRLSNEHVNDFKKQILNEEDKIKVLLSMFFFGPSLELVVNENGEKSIRNLDFPIGNLVFAERSNNYQQSTDLFFNLLNNFAGEFSFGDISNYYDYLKINELVEEISNIFSLSSDRFITELYKVEDFLKEVFNHEKINNANLKGKLPNLLEELFYSIYIMNPDSSSSSSFTIDNKREALRIIKNYLHENGYNPNDLGLDEKELFDNYYDVYMNIIESSLKYEENGKQKIIKLRELDSYDTRIWYKIQEYRFKDFLNQDFNNLLGTKGELNEVTIHLFHLRNIARVKARIVWNNIPEHKNYMVTDPALTWQNLLNKNNNDISKIYESSMYGRVKIDNKLVEALVNDKENLNHRKYRDWCQILGVDYQDLLEFIYVRSSNNIL